MKPRNPVSSRFERSEATAEAIATNETQLARIIAVNKFRVTVAFVRPLEKRVRLTGPDAGRALAVLIRNGWTEMV